MTMATVVQDVAARYLKPWTLKETIINVLQDAGPGGLTLKEMVQRIKKKKLWDWENDRQCYYSVSERCYRCGDVFARVAPGTYALWALQDDTFTPYEKPWTLKEAIILVLQDAGPGGFTGKEIVQRIKKNKWWDWKDNEAGYNSVSAICRDTRYLDVFVRVAPGTWSLWALQDDDFDPNGKPMSLKETIINVLQDAGPGGLTLKEMVQRIKKKKLWDWKDDKAGYYSVSAICRYHTYRDIFVHVAPGTFALSSLQDDDFTPYVSPGKPRTLKEAIILVLQEAGPGGLTLKEMVQRIKKKFSWDWENYEQGYNSVTGTCANLRNRDIFVRVALGTYALWALQDDDFTPYEEPAKSMELKEAIIIVLQEAGPGGFTGKEIVQRIKKNKWWDWKNDLAGYNSVSAICRDTRYRDVFVRVAPGTWSLWALQDDDFDPNGKPRTLKEAIILVLQDAGPGGLTLKEMVQRILKKKWWDWKDDEAGYDSVSGMCGSPKHRDVFVHVAPGTYALWALQDDDFTLYEKPMTLKEAIIIVLQEAGPEGLHIKEIVQSIKKRFCWDWKDDEEGYNSVRKACCGSSRHRDIFARVAPGTYALWALQDDTFTLYEKPMTLKECIINVLQDAGPGGLTLKEMVQRIKKKKLWDWENDEQGYNSVTAVCGRSPDVFVKHSPGVYALRSLQGGEGEGERSSKTLANAKASDAERTASGTKRTRQAASGSKDELNPISVKKKKKKQAEEEWTEDPQSYVVHEDCIIDSDSDEDFILEPVPTTYDHSRGGLQEPQSHVVPVEEKRLLLYTDEQKEAADKCLERALEQARAGRRSAGRPKEIGKASSSESEERSFSDLTFITVTDFTMAELKAIADTENKRIGILSNV